MERDWSVFENDDFDLIEYVNKKFPDETALESLDSEISCIQQKISDLESELSSELRSQARNNSNARAELENANQMTKKLVSEIRDLQLKSKASEDEVHEMCKEIKLLDTAKHNISESINCLRFCYEEIL